MMDSLRNMTVDETLRNMTVDETLRNTTVDVTLKNMTVVEATREIIDHSVCKHNR
jgi:hypothetical protein